MRPDGEEMTEDDWQDSENRTIGMLLPGRAADEVDVRGRLVESDTLLLLLNASSRRGPGHFPGSSGPGGGRSCCPRRGRASRGGPSGPRR